MVSDPKASPDREQTNESLREERSKTDRALAERQAALQDSADEVLHRARENADEVLHRARSKADHQLERASEEIVGTTVVESRALEDEALRAERATADATLQRERAETARALARLLPRERDKTDRFLLTERARSDMDVSQRDNFLAMVSHDLRNLLGGIVMNAEILSAKTKDSTDGALVTSGMAQIESYAARMNRLIGDLLDVASIDSGVLAMTPTSGDARKLISDAVELFRAAAATKRIRIDIDVTGGKLIADFDHDRLLQVFANLLSNAIKFSVEDTTVAVRAAQEGKLLHFSVEDRGIGVPTDMLELIFERFWQVGKNDRRGTGLGLYISRCIVEAHGGKIWAVSKSGHGTAIHFTIPMR